MSTDTIDIREVTQTTGVTSRALRHYDDIGLLAPAWTGNDGRRHYGKAELHRLQHILVLRELGVDLATVERIIGAADADTVITLMRDHLQALTAERDRYARLATTVGRTIDALEGGRTMTTEEIFDGFAHVKYEPEARERWGDAAVDSGNANWDCLGEVGKKAHRETDREIVEALGAAARIKLAAASDEVQDVVARHYEWITAIWIPNAEAYRNLTQMYVDDERFRSHYNEIAPGAAELLRDAAHIYASRNLS